MSFLLEQAKSNLEHSKQLLIDYQDKAPKRLATHGKEDRGYRATLRAIANTQKRIKDLEKEIIEITERNKILNAFKLERAEALTTTVQ